MNNNEKPIIIPKQWCIFPTEEQFPIVIEWATNKSGHDYHNYKYNELVSFDNTGLYRNYEETLISFEIFKYIIRTEFLDQFMIMNSDHWPGFHKDWTTKDAGDNYFYYPKIDNNFHSSYNIRTSEHVEITTDVFLHQFFFVGELTIIPTDVILLDEYMKEAPNLFKIKKLNKN